MAGGSVIGALRVVIGADTAALDKGLKDSQGRLASFAAGAARAGALIGAAVVGAMAGIGVAIKRTIDDADRLGELAESLGVPVDELSRLRHAAEMSGSSLEGLSRGMQGFIRRLPDAVNGSGSAAAAFTALGISVKDGEGKVKSAGDIITEVAEKFAGMEDGAGKSAIAMKIFGRSGADLIPMLNRGAAGLQELKNEADALGLTIDGKTAAAAGAFNDTLDRMGKVKDGIIQQVTARMLPAFTTLSEILLATAKNTQLMDMAASVLTFTLKGLVTAGVVVGAVFKTVWEALSRIVAAVMQVIEGDFKSAMTTLEGFAGEASENIRGTISVIGKVWDSTANEVAAGAAATGKKLAAPIMQATAQAKSALDKFFEQTARRNASMIAESQAVGLAAGEQEKLKVALQAEALAKQNNIVLTDQLRERIALLAAETANATLKLQGAQLVQQNLAPHEAYRLELENNRLALAAFGATAEQVAAVQEATAQRYGATWAQVAPSVAGSFQQIAQAFGKENKKMAMAAKIMAIVQGTISMFVGAAKALELPFPANLAAMASVLATGAGLVAQIKGVAVPGASMATGGSFTVPGGHSMTDNVVMPLGLAAGERVTVDRPEGGSTGSSRPREMTVKLEGDLFTRAHMRRLFESMNDMLDDGYTLKVA